VLWKEPHEIWVTKIIQIDPIEFNMFKLEHIDDYAGL